MQIFLLYLFLFIVGCFFGWCLEIFFRRMFTAKRWVNPGFMKGPWLPLYGFGVIIMFSMCYLCVSIMPDNFTFYNPLGNLFGRTNSNGPSPFDLIPLGLMWLGMNLLEFVAGLIFIKGFKVKLWDYSNVKGNIMGIVCPLFSALWLVVALIYYYAINPFLYILSTNVHDYMFGGDGMIAHFGFVFALGLVYGIFVYDFVVSIGVFKKIVKIAKESVVLEKYEAIRDRFSEAIKNTKSKISSYLPKHETEVEEGKTLKEKIVDAIYIDPEKENPSANYDESGRPIKYD